MSQPPVSIHPYFKAHSGKLPEILALLPAFVKKSAAEEKILQYEFTVSGDVIFCRESYRDAQGALAHLANVEALLKEMLAISDLIRLELHGPSGELEKLEAPLESLKPMWFAVECGLTTL
jgi:quinol monooxygenase YgiN